MRTFKRLAEFMLMILIIPLAPFLMLYAIAYCDMNDLDITPTPPEAPHE